MPNTVYYHRRLAEGELPLDTDGLTPVNVFSDEDAASLFGRKRTPSAVC
ncbi:MAG: hypothetical protein ACMX3H_19045 [Sodalis sp. (in: enterobacteria)]